MKCKECRCCKQGFFPSQPDAYVCTGVKMPFVISDVNVECTEYAEWRTSEEQPEEFDRHTALRVLQDISSKMYPNINLFGEKTLDIRRKDFEAIRAKYLDRKD